MHLRALAKGSIAVGLFLASAPASAQVLDMTTSVLQHPPSGANGIVGNATHVALGRYSDDAVPDAAVLHGTSVHLVYAPDRRNAWSKASGSYTSIVRLPGYVTATGRDAVLASTSTGLSALVWDGSPSVRTLVPSALSGTSSWANATDLQVYSFSPTSFEVVGLAAGGGSLLRRSWNSGSGAFGGTTTFPVASSSQALAPLQWDTDPELEYATASSTGLKVYDNSGSAMSWADEPAADPILLAVTDVGTPHRLAWMRAPMSGVEQLNVVRSTGSTSVLQEAAHLYWGCDITHMALIELDTTYTPQGKELWLSSNAMTYGVGLRRGTTTTFQEWPANPAFLADLDTQNSAYGWEEPTAGSGVYGGANTSPVPGVMDMDGDGDEDLFLAGHPGQAGRALLCFSTVYNEERDILNSGRVKPWLTHYTFQITGSPGAQTGTLGFGFPSKPANGPAAAATHVRFAVWTQALNATQATYVSHLDIVIQTTPPAPLITIPNIHQLQTGGSVHIEVSYLKFNGTAMDASWPALMETVPVDLSNSSQQMFEDRVWWNFINGQDGTTASGSTARPPISPPTGGVTP